MTRKTDYQERKDKVFGIVVEEYIKTISPVSSGFIASEYHLDLSPATIRNILAELEEEGYLTHPHTSAGRIPTQLGYRYYVDYLMQEIQLLEEEKQRIKAEYHKSVLELEALLEKTSEVISDLTHYTSIISVDGLPYKVFYHGTQHVVEYPESVDLVKVRNILQALEEKARLLQIINRDLERKVKIYIGHETSYSEIENCSLAVTGYTVENGPSGRIAVLGPTRMDYERVVSTLDYISDLMSELL
jgi:transcriptional regulator of heat shock response